MLRHKTTVAFGAVTVGVALLAYYYLQYTPRTFAEAVRQANEVVIYEGLPHQMWEPELLEEERRNKDVVELDGYPFYQRPVKSDRRDAESLSAVLGDPATYHAWKGPKMCGGFHPDYAVEWHIGESRYRVLICLGCGEFKLSGPWLWSRSRYNMDKDTTGEKLKDLLKGYDKSRPKGWWYQR